MLGDQEPVEHNAVTGWAFVRGSYESSVEFTVEEYTWDDVLQHYWAHSRSAFEDEHECWVFGRPVRHIITKSPNK